EIASGNSFSKIELYHSPIISCRVRDHNVAQPNIGNSARDSAGDSHHQAKAKGLEARAHIGGDESGRSRTIYSRRQACNDDIVFADIPKSITVIVTLRQAQILMNVIQHSLRRSPFTGECANPSDSVIVA